MKSASSTERVQTCLRDLEEALHVPEVTDELDDTVLRVLENRIRTLADHLSVEVRRRLYPHAFASNGAG